MRLCQENNSHCEIESKNSFGWWDQETPPLPPSTVSLTTPISVEAGAFPFPTRLGYIGRRNLLGPALAGASVRAGEGQKDFPDQQRRKTPAPCVGAVVFFLSLTSRRLEQSPPFLGGAVLCSSFSFFVLIHVSTWTDLQHILKSHVKDKMVPNGFNRKSYAKMLIRRFKFVARNPTREKAEEFCKWLLDKIT